MNKLLALMHDTANVSSLINTSIYLLKKDIIDGNMSKEVIVQYLDKLWEYNMKHVSILDKFYIENKELYAEKRMDKRGSAGEGK